MAVRPLALAVVAVVAAVAKRLPAETLPPPSNPRVVCSEKTLELTWDSVPGADGYNVYTSPASGVPRERRRKVNQALVTSGNRFIYIWDIRNGERVRGVKGQRHHLAVTSVDTSAEHDRESALSAEVDNDYLSGFDNASSAKALATILRRSQTSEKLPVEEHVNDRKRFIAFMEGPGALYQKLIRDTLDAREVGACAPLSTVAVRLMLAWGIRAWKAEGTFIKEYHSFVVVNVDGVEYVVDFAADQFVPDVSPVVVPRDYCHLNDQARLAANGQPIYTIAKLYSPEKSELRDTEAARVYRELVAAVLEAYGKAVTGTD